MKIMEAIDRADQATPNIVPGELKIKWLDTLDRTVDIEILQKYERAVPIAFEGYTQQTPMDVVLLVPAPWDDVYVYWLQAYISQEMRDFDSYSYYMLQADHVLTGFRNFYNSTHRRADRADWRY